MFGKKTKVSSFLQPELPDRWEANSSSTTFCKNPESGFIGMEREFSTHESEAWKGKSEGKKQTELFELEFK